MKKICVMHQASIGDTLLATPVYRAIKEKYPTCELVVVTSRNGQELLHGNPYIDKMIAYQKGDSSWRVIWTIWRSDVAMILDLRYRNALYAFLAMIPQRFGRGKDFINRKVVDRDSLLYEPLKYLDIASAAIGVSSTDTRLSPMHPTEKEKDHVREIMRTVLKSGGGEGCRYGSSLLIDFEGLGA